MVCFLEVGYSGNLSEAAKNNCDEHANSHSVEMCKLVQMVASQNWVGHYKNDGCNSSYICHYTNKIYYQSLMIPW